MEPNLCGWMYVIQRRDGKFVSKPGSKHSYTSKLQDARTYRTRLQAVSDMCCDNEQVLTIEQAMNG